MVEDGSAKIAGNVAVSASKLLVEAQNYVAESPDLCAEQAAPAVKLPPEYDAFVASKPPKKDAQTPASPEFLLVSGKTEEEDKLSRKRAFSIKRFLV